MNRVPPPKKSEYTTIRKIYAWIGFITVLVAVCAVLYSLAYAFSHTERADTFYQQTEKTQL